MAQKNIPKKHSSKKSSKKKSKTPDKKIVHKNVRQTDEQIKKIMNNIYPEPFDLRYTNVYEGSSKRVFVDDNPNNPRALLTSVYQTMKDPDSIMREYLYTRYLHSLFPHLIVNELPLNINNKPLANLLNSGRGLLITKKPIVEDSYDIERLLVFMMESTDELIDNGFANLDLKPGNIGIIKNKYLINDNGSNMFYPIPFEDREYYREAIKLTGLSTLRGLTKKLFKKHYHLYPNVNLKNALELYKTDIGEDTENKIRKYVEKKLETIEVDDKPINLSIFSKKIVFPFTILQHYVGADIDSFTQKILSFLPDA